MYLIGDIERAVGGREPVRAPSRRYGWKYGSVKLLKRGAKIAPLAAPRARIRVAALLP